MRELAQKAKCSAAAIMQIELGRSAISGKLLHNIARGLDVQPFDLLNLDTQNDDLGYVIEKLRQDPEAWAAVKAQFEASGYGGERIAKLKKLSMSLSHLR